MSSQRRPRIGAGRCYNFLQSLSDAPNSCGPAVVSSRYDILTGKPTMLSQALSSTSSIVLPLGHTSHCETPAPRTLHEHFSRAVVRTFAAKEHVFTEGDPRTNLYRVEAGAVCLYKVMGDGRRQVLGF